MAGDSRTKQRAGLEGETGSVMGRPSGPGDRTEESEGAKAMVAARVSSVASTQSRACS